MKYPLSLEALRLPLLAVLMSFPLSRAQAAEPFVRTTASTYFPGEDIVASFGNGPGNPKDWIGVYPVDVVPGSVGSTIWWYVDGTQAGTVGLREGTVTFPGGLNLAGDWAMYFLLNDAYTALATNLFSVIEEGTSALRLDKRTYTIGETITATFTNGPANAKDWVGVYHVGDTPGPVPSTIWAYVDGTQTGTTGIAAGSVSFATGLAQAGEYVAYFLLNDGYDVIGTETFTVLAPAGTLPRVISVDPADGASNRPPDLTYSAVLTNGTSRVVPSTIVLKFDDVVVTSVVSSNNGLISVVATNQTLPAPGSAHTWLLTLLDDATPATEIRAESHFTIGAYRNIVLPAPLYFENFDAVPEGSLPTGWTEKGYSTPINEAVDFGDLGSAAYRTWTTVNAERFRGSFVTYGNPDNPPAWGTDYQRVLSVNTFNVVNGQVLREPLAQGRFLFGNSGYQNGSASQVLYLFTPDFDLTGRTNVYLGFKSLWEQNQDSIGAIEYSVDSGQTWLPIAYFLEGPDIVTVTNEVSGEVSIDAEATFTQEFGDVARYTDDEGNDVGGTYGAFIAAPISPALAPFIQARVNDNPVESKRFEWFRLPQADSKPKVRLRFAHAGTDSWYFGIDDFGLYAPSGDEGPGPTLTVAREAADVVVSWPASATGYVLETATSLVPTIWAAVPGVTGNSYRATPSGTNAFYRLRK